MTKQQLKAIKDSWSITVERGLNVDRICKLMLAENEDENSEHGGRCDEVMKRAPKEGKDPMDLAVMDYIMHHHTNYEKLFFALPEDHFEVLADPLYNAVEEEIYKVYPMLAPAVKGKPYDKFDL